MRRLALLWLVALLLVALPLWGQGFASRDFEEDDADSISLGDNDAFTFNTGGADDPFTLMAWTNIEAYNGGERLITKYNVTGNLREYQMQQIGTAGVYCRLYNGPASGALEVYDTSGSNGVGEWHHHACAYDGSENATGLKVWTDGVELAASASELGTYTGMTNQTSNLQIGGHQNDAATGYTDGLIAYVQIFDRQLSAAEINRAMLCPGSVVKGLLVYHPLSDSGLKDYTGNGYDGTNSGTVQSGDGPPIRRDCA